MAGSALAQFLRIPRKPDKKEHEKVGLTWKLTLCQCKNNTKIATFAKCVQRTKNISIT
jgi:hypothetical protein